MPHVLSLENYCPTTRTPGILVVNFVDMSSGIPGRSQEPTTNVDVLFHPGGHYVPAPSGFDIVSLVSLLYSSFGAT